MLVMNHRAELIMSCKQFQTYMWFFIYLNLICNFCSCYLKKKKKFTSVVCSCLAFRDLLTESITIDEYLFSLSPSKFNCNAFLRIKHKQNFTHSYIREYGNNDLPIELNMTSPRGIPKLAQNMVNTMPLVVFGVECPYPVHFKRFNAELNVCKL